MKTHKIMFLAVAALLFLMPPVNAQDEESAESGGSAEAGEEKAESADKPGGGADGEKGKAGEEAPEKKTMFSDHQKQIKALREKKQKLEEAGRRRDAGKVLDTLKQEQKKLKTFFEKEASKHKTEIAHLKEQSKKTTNPAIKKKLEEDLKKHEEELKTLEADADLNSWCTELKEKDAASQEKNKTAAKSKAKKKSKITTRKKKKK